jgi:hypothetical protein
MSPQPRSIGAAAAEAAVAAAWAQWSALGSAASPRRETIGSSIVDPEALILASVAFAPHERRLPDVAAGWAIEGAKLLSIRRLRRLISAYPSADQERAGFAVKALEGGAREGKTAPRLTADAEVRSKPAGPLRLQTGPALMLRMRAAFGVGVKADVVTVLLGSAGQPMSLRELAAAAGYTSRAVRIAAEEIELAGLAEQIPGQPVEYRVHPEAWVQLLGPRRLDRDGHADPVIPAWRAWSVVYPFLAQVTAWAGEAEASGWSDYVASSRARDLVEQHRPALLRAGVRDVPKQGGRGAEFLDDFREVVQRVARWTEEEV